MKAWCPTCRTMRMVTDQHDESHYAQGSEHGQMVTDFDCGHTTETTPRIIGPAPGAPSTGGVGLPVAASARTRDLVKARQQHTDPWAES